MKQSQYTEAYLDAAEARLEAGKKPLTPGSFLANTLRGVAKTYIGRYEDSLIRSLRLVGAVETPSAKGGTAYRRNPRHAEFKERIPCADDTLKREAKAIASRMDAETLRREVLAASEAQTIYLDELTDEELTTFVNFNETGASNAESKD